MKKSTLTSVFLSAVVLASAGMSYALASEATEAQQPKNAPSRVAPAVPYMDTYFTLDDGGAIEISINAPSIDNNGGSLTSKMTIRLSRECKDADLTEAKKLINTWTGVNPGESLTYLDKDVVANHTYTYYIQAIANNEASVEMYYEVKAGYTPSRVEELDVYSDNGMAPITITGIVPTTISGDLPFPEGVQVNYIRIRRGVYMEQGSTHEIAVIRDNINPGKPFTYIDNDPELTEGKRYMYFVSAGCDYGVSYEEIRYISLGEGIPNPPSNVKATLARDGKSCTVTWTPPISGIENTYIDPYELVYDIYRHYGPTEETLLAEDLEADVLEYVDTFEDMDRERTFSYVVKATNKTGTSDGGYSNQITAGPVYTIPFYETFNRKAAGGILTTDNNWTRLENKITGGETWMLRNFNMIKSGSEWITFFGYNHEGEHYAEDEIEDGFLTMQLNQIKNGENEYVSGPISLVGSSQPCLYLKWYYLPGNTSRVTIYVEPESEIKNSDNWAGEYIELGKIKDDDVPGWKTFSMDLSSIKNVEVVKIRFKGVATDGKSTNMSIALDEIALYDNSKPVGVKNIAGYRADDATGRIIWEQDIYQVAHNFDVYVDNQLVGNTSSNRIDFATQSSKSNYEVKIVSHFANGSTSEATAVVNIESAGIESVIDMEAVSVEYFDLTGMPVVNPTAGQLVIARYILTDGTVKTIKKIVR